MSLTLWFPGWFFRGCCLEWLNVILLPYESQITYIFPAFQYLLAQLVSPLVRELVCGKLLILFQFCATCYFLHSCFGASHILRDIMENCLKRHTDQPSTGSHKETWLSIPICLLFTHLAHEKEARYLSYLPADMPANTLTYLRVHNSLPDREFPESIPTRA